MTPFCTCGKCRNCEIQRLHPNAVPPTKGLGDAVAKALASVGVTPERVSAWLGAPCGCAERKQKLNDFSTWVASQSWGRIKDAMGVRSNDSTEQTTVPINEDPGVGQGGGVS